MSTLTTTAPDYNAVFKAHNEAALSTDLATYHLSAYGTSRYYIGGIVGLLRKVLTHDAYQGKNPVIRELDDKPTSGPKFRKVNRVIMHALITNYKEHGFFTHDEAEALRAKF
jgi:hypothetical protein